MAERNVMVTEGDDVAAVTITDIRGDDLSRRLVMHIEQKAGLAVTEAEA